MPPFTKTVEPVALPSMAACSKSGALVPADQGPAKAANCPAQFAEAPQLALGRRVDVWWSHRQQRADGATNAREGRSELRIIRSVGSRYRRELGYSPLVVFVDDQWRPVHIERGHAS